MHRFYFCTNHLENFNYIPTAAKLLKLTIINTAY